MNDSNSININFLILKDLSEKNNWHQVFEHFKLLNNESKHCKNVLFNDIENIIVVLQKASLNITKDQQVILVLSEGFRFFRNLCPNNTLQNYFCKNDKLIDIIQNVFIYLKQTDSQKDLFINCWRVCIQFLGNLVVNNSINQIIIWKNFKIILRENLYHKDAKVQNFSCMVIYNILLNNYDDDLVNDVQFHQCLLELAAKKTEFSIFILQIFFVHEAFIRKIYFHLNAEYQCLLLEALYVSLLSDEIKISSDSIFFLIEQLKKSISYILSTSSTKNEQNIEAVVVTKLLQLITFASSLPSYIEVMQKDRLLLIDVASTLRAMHMAGKSQENAFTPIQKLSHLAQSSINKSNDLESHPAFGFKAHLVQLIGNLSAKCRENQDLIRELDTIPVLLDCTNIDARNPLLPQRVIVTLRYILEDNQENQLLITSLEKKEYANTPLIQELGIQIKTE